ncbi:MAG: sulfatase [Bacteroidetes bacterium]|nr:sulfatase [Bacteroidota bacterium]
MKYYLSILYRFLLALGLLLLTQIAFYIFNSNLFNVDGARELFTISIGAIRYAVASTVIYLSIYLLLALLPITLRQNRYYRNITNFFYILGTQLMIIINIIDIGYFKFTYKRITYDFFNYLGVGGDFKELIPQFARDYWHIVLIYLAINFVFGYLNKRIRKKYSTEYIIPNAKWYIRSSSLFIFLSLLSMIGLRGGFQLRPLHLIQANYYTSSQNSALVLNTPFTLYRTFGKEGIDKRVYFQDQKEMNQYFTPIITPIETIDADSLFASPLSVGKTNVVVIILESFSSEYMGYYHNEEGGKKHVSYTPFLDSLARKSIVFDGYANGKRSIDGIPAVLSSLPLLMNETYITSQYNSNGLSSFASLLEPFGYKSSFFHGGYNGSMGFDAFTRHVGYNDYYGRNEYGNDKDYDGNWGIFDEPFLQYMVKQLDKYKEPFNSAVFTLSSHHPYTIPAKHIGRFPKGTMIVHETVGYADYALRRFFEEASKKPWFKNTLFIITADHSAQTSEPEFTSFLGSFRIPIIFYHPLLKQGVNTKQYMQQSDILPSAMSLIHFPKPVVGFGQNIFSNKEKFYILDINDEYILRIGDYVTKFRDGLEPKLYFLPGDSNTKKDISSSKKDITNKYILKTKAIIQEYNTRLIGNKLVQ